MPALTFRRPTTTLFLRMTQRTQMSGAIKMLSECHESSRVARLRACTLTCPHNDNSRQLLTSTY